MKKAVFLFLFLIISSQVFSDGFIPDRDVQRTNDVIFYSLEYPTLHGFDLTWSESIDDDFAFYEVRRSISAGVSAASTLVDTISVREQLNCTDTSADIGTTYFYKLFVVNETGERSIGSNELSGTTQRVTFPFTDDFEGDLSNWDYDLPWGITDETSNSGDHCMADSPYLLYGHNLNITLRTAVDLSQAQRPMLSYWQRYNIDTADFGYVEVSTDGGSNWTLLIQLTGAQLDWQQKNLDLSSYVGMDNLKIRFRFYTNANTTQDGWFIDDVQFIENETELDYPYYDQMDDESTYSMWMNTGYWDWQEEGGYEGGCWHDSPNGNSPNYDTNITLAGPISFAGITSPQLSFWHKYYFYYHSSNSSYRDYGYVQISVDDGQTWTNVGGAYQNYSSGWPNQWHHVQIDLSPYGGEDALIRFYIDDRYSSSQDGWYIDEVAIQDQPAASILQMPSDIGLHTMQLNWTANTTENFDRYEIYRRTSSGISLTNAELIATITDPQQMNYTDTGLEISRTYYYKVYQVNTGNIFDSGSNEVSAVTEDIGYPFTENFEGDDINWDLQGDWAFAADDAYTGSYSLTDSPGGLHQNNLNVWAKTGIDLSDAVNPQLTFYQHYHFGEGDYGYIYISTDNETSWFTADQFMLSDLEWSEYKLNLSPWAGYSSVRIGFKLYSNSLNVQDGWYIDDLVIDENPQIIEFPFYDAMDDESSSINWNPSFQWSRMIDGGYEGGCWHDSPDGNSPNIDTQLILAGPISFAGITSPQLSFWHKYHFYYHSSQSNYRDYGYVQISVDNGHTWATIGGAYQSYSAGWPDQWHHVQIDISAYGGEDVIIRFYVDDRYTSSQDGWFIDEVAIQDQPAAAMLLPISNIQRHNVQLSWLASPNSGFDRFEIYRNTSSGVTNTNSTLVATLSDPADSSYTDTGLEIGRTYYYRIYVVNDGDIYDPGSNELSVTTLNLDYPYFEDCEGTTENWDFQGTWAFADDDAYSGDYSLTDSPGTLHSNNQDIWVKTGIDLSQAVNPQLSFWQHYHFGEGDYGQIYISSNNESSWTLADQFSAANLEWKQYKFNLSPWIGTANLRIGFKFHSNSLNVQDGWYLDDISIAENTETIAFPFYDAMDDELSRENWNSTFYWDRLEDGGYEGGCWHDSPYGNSPALDTQLILSAPVSFAGITSPQLSFWHKHNFYYYNGNSERTDYGFVQISSNNGQNWTTIATYTSTNAGWPDEWQHVQIDISSYGGEDVLIRFYIDDRWDYTSDGWYIDEVAIWEQMPTVPDFVQLESPAAVYATMGFPTCNIYGLVYEPEVTDGVGQGELVTAQLGFGADGSYPGDNWSWTDAFYLNDSEDGTMDRYVGTLTVIEPGAFDYAFRFSTTGGENWVYADLDGNMAGQGTTNFYTPDQAGALAVADAPEINLNVEQVNITLPTGRSGNRAFNIGNQGLGTLGYSIETTGSVSWLNILPVSGTVEPEENMNVILSFCAVGLPADSVFITELTLTSNDPGNSSIVLPVSMQVLEENASEFSGVVRNTQGEIIFPATIEVWNDTTLVEEISTFTDGYFAIYGLESGIYDVRAFARDYYPRIVNNVNIPLLGLAFNLTRVYQALPSPEQVNVYSSNTMFDDLPVRTGDIITAKDTDGIVCGIYQVHTSGSFGFMHIYADDTTTGMIDEGANPGETLTFYINDFPAQYTGGDAPVWTQNNAILNIDLAAQKEDVVSLNAGWNLFSFAMLPADDDIAEMLTPLDGNYRQVSSFDLNWGDGGANGARTYDPELPQFSDLLSLDPYHGYWIKLDEAAELPVCGSKFYDTTTMYLEAGWNLTSYLPEDERAIEDGFASIYNNLIIASGFDNGAMTYEPGSPFSDLLTLENGSGYWVNLGYFDILDYSIRGMYEPLILAGAEAGKIDIVPFYPQTRDDVVVTPWWSDFYGQITYQDEALPAGTQVSAIDPDGVICGEFTVSTDGQYGFMHIYGDDPATENDEGAISGDIICFEIDGVMAEETGIWQSGNPGIITNLNLNCLTNPSGGDIDEIPANTCLLGNYPNPFNPETEIRFNLAEASQVLLEIYNLKGQKIFTVVDKKLEADLHSYVWNGKDTSGNPAASGVYFYKLVAGNYQSVNKMLLLK